MNEFPTPVPEIPVTDMDQALDYYARKLGFDIDWGGAGGGMIIADWIYGVPAGYFYETYIDELEPLIAVLAEQYPWIAATRSTLALMYADACRYEEADAIIDALLPILESAGDAVDIREALLTAGFTEVRAMPDIPRIRERFPTFYAVALAATR